MVKDGYSIVHCYYCGEPISNEGDLVEKKIPLVCKNGKKRMFSRKLHYWCVPKIVNDIKIDSEVKLDEKYYWDKCYRKMQQWLGSERGLDQFAVMRIQGLRVGKFAPNGTNTMGLRRGFEYQVIYNTMVWKSLEVDKMIHSMEFHDNKHKINAIMKIITERVGETQLKMEQQNRANRALDRVKEEIPYKTVEEFSGNKGFSHLKDDRSDALKNLVSGIDEDDDDVDDLFS